jgi:hypothetical protein
MKSSFVKPAYGSHCFSDLPATVSYWLTGQGQPPLERDALGTFARRYDTVIFFFIDAFGWRFFEQFHAHPALHRMTSNGHSWQLTSQFPSTTAAHVTTMHTGLPVGQSGIYEWFYYEPQVDSLIAPLLFSYAGGYRRDTLKTAGITPASLYPPTTFYQTLAASGIQSTVFQHRDFTPSTFSDWVFRGARVQPYRTLSEAFTLLRQRLERGQAQSYYFFYFDAIDTIGHQYGPGSPQFAAEVDAFLTLLDRQFLQPLARRQSSSLLVFTADHGQVEINPSTTIYLNQDPHFNGLDKFLRTSKQGAPLAPAGSARDLFLYVYPDHLEEAQSFLASRLDGRADVVLVADLIAQGYFGPLPLSDEFMSRVGNVVCLPYAGESVFWYEKGKFEQHFYGHHGGLTPQEMQIPLVLYDFAG